MNTYTCSTVNLNPHTNILNLAFDFLKSRCLKHFNGSTFATKVPKVAVNTFLLQGSLVSDFENLFFSYAKFI